MDRVSAAICRIRAELDRHQMIENTAVPGPWVKCHLPDATAPTLRLQSPAGDPICRSLPSSPHSAVDERFMQGVDGPLLFEIGMEGTFDFIAEARAHDARVRRLVRSLLDWQQAFRSQQWVDEAAAAENQLADAVAAFLEETEQPEVANA